MSDLTSGCRIKPSRRSLATLSAVNVVALALGLALAIVSQGGHYLVLKTARVENEAPQPRGSARSVLRPGSPSSRR